MSLPSKFNPQEHTFNTLRVIHNKALNKFFLGLQSDDNLLSNRAHLRTALRIRDTDSAVDLANKQLSFGALRSRAEVPIATIPEWWPLRAGSDRPQLVLAFRPAKQKTTYFLHIPHYDGTRRPKIPSYKKGSWRCEQILKDGSKLVVNAASEAEGRRVITVLKRYVKVEYLTGSTFKAVQIRGTFKEVRVLPVIGDYYRRGQKTKGLKPDWRVYLRGS